MNLSKYILLFILCSCWGSVNAQASYDRVELSFIPWQRLSRADLSPKFVRANADVFIVLRDASEIDGLLKLLELDKMDSTLSDQAGSSDTRLVIDLFHRSKRTSYYATKFHLFNEAGKRKRSIDEAFRSKFRLFGGGSTRS